MQIGPAIDASRYDKFVRRNKSPRMVKGRPFEGKPSSRGKLSCVRRGFIRRNKGHGHRGRAVATPLREGEK